MEVSRNNVTFPAGKSVETMSHFAAGKSVEKM